MTQILPQKDFAHIRFDQTVNQSDHGLVREFGVSAATSGTQHLSMAFGMVPARSKSKRHYHPFETAVYMVSGQARAYFGANDEQAVDMAPGDFLYIPAYMIHSTENTGDTPVEYVLSRAAPEDLSISAE